MVPLFHTASMEVTETYSGGGWSGLGEPIKVSRIQQGMLEGRAQLGLVTQRQTQWPFLHGSLVRVKILIWQLRATREYVSKQLSRRCKFHCSLTLKIQDILFLKILHILVSQASP